LTSQGDFPVFPPLRKTGVSSGKDEQNQQESGLEEVEGKMLAAQPSF
jgi:hypothetical protein